MQTSTLTIPSIHLAWFRTKVAAEFAVDIQEEAPSADALTEADFVKLKGLADRALLVFKEIGYPNHPISDGVTTLVMPVGEARTLMNELCAQIGEDMLVATGHYDGSDYDYTAVRLVCDRTLWLNEQAEKVATEEVA